jgi:ABC-type antimicrobial peptide transport system permease subunit
VQVGLGLLAGALLAAVTAPLLGEVLQGSHPRDPLVYGSVAVVLTVSGLLAAVGPARRALRVDVARSLQGE